MVDEVSDYNDFDTFSLVATEGSIRRAAQRLGVSQPLVSRRITRLEHELGHQLLERSKGGVTLTAAGARLMPYIREVVRLMSEALAEVRAAATAGTFEITTDATLAPIVVPFAIEALRDTPVGLSNRTLPTSEAVRAVAEGDTDVAFGQWTLEAGAHRYQGLASERLFDDRLAVIVANDHPLTTREHVRGADLVAHPVVIVGDCPGGELAVDHLTIAGLRRQDLRIVQPADTALSLAILDAHVAITLRAGLLHLPPSVGLVELDVIDLPRWPIEVDFVFRTVDAEREPVRLLRSAVQLARRTDAIVGRRRYRA